MSRFLLQLALRVSPSLHHGQQAHDFSQVIPPNARRSNRRLSRRPPPSVLPYQDNPRHGPGRRSIPQPKRAHPCPTPHPEWRILAELAQQPLATPELRERLRHGPPMSRYVFSTRLSRLRAWGWITAARSEGRRPAVMVYSITEQGLQALELVRQ